MDVEETFNTTYGNIDSGLRKDIKNENLTLDINNNTGEMPTLFDNKYPSNDKINNIINNKRNKKYDTSMGPPKKKIMTRSSTNNISNTAQITD
jgi:hypothetical protein